MILRVSDIEVELTRKDIKHMYLRVLPLDGRVSVSAPYGVSEKVIAEFVGTKLSWIRKKQAVIEQRQHEIQQRQRDLEEQRALRERQSLEQGESAQSGIMYVWGKQYVLRIVGGTRYRMELRGDDAIFTVRTESTPEQHQAWLREWQRNRLCEAIERMLPTWEERTGLYPTEWRTKYMKTRWGTCNTKAKRLWFNVQLVKYPPECLDYVVLHELAHLKEPSHNADFKAILDTHMPSWRSVRKKLNELALNDIE